MYPSLKMVRPPTSGGRHAGFLDPGRTPPALPTARPESVGMSSEQLATIPSNTLVREAYIKAGVFKPTLGFDARTLSGPEMADGLGKAPLAQHPGTTWECSLSLDVQGRVVEAVTGQRLGEFLRQRLFAPLKMADSVFQVSAAKAARLAEALTKDPATGADNELIDLSQQPGNDSGGAGGVSTTGDYVRYCHAMLNGGQLEGVRILSRSTVQLMTSDHLGPALAAAAVNPDMLLLGTPGTPSAWVSSKCTGNPAFQGRGDSVTSARRVRVNEFDLTGSHSSPHTG